MQATYEVKISWQKPVSLEYWIRIGLDLIQGYMLCISTTSPDGRGGKWSLYPKKMQFSGLLALFSPKYRFCIFPPSHNHPLVFCRTYIPESMQAEPGFCN